MADFDLEAYLAPISEDAPCGDTDLEYDDAFMELDRIAKGEEERQSGDELIPARDPEWKDVRKVATGLMGRTRDLRVGMHFARAEAALDGVLGFARGVALLRGYVERHWEAVFPRLEPGDDFDPTRVNAIAPLGASDGLLGIMRRAVLVEARNVGRFSLRDLDVAEQRAPAPADGMAATLELLRGALSEAGEEFGRTHSEALAAALEDMKALVAIFRSTPSGMGPDVEELEALLRRGLSFLQSGLESSTAGAEEVAAESSGDEGQDDNLARASGGGGRAGGGELRTREDAKRILEQVCVFLERTEPSNPAPILIRRARALLDRGFFDIIQNVAPEALVEIQKLAGPADWA